ncbi:MAG: tetratricopeptide repeat protein [Clostridiaceae bacterium]|jgi:tetratricopeptide (TPR) repeat protein|nr:tetratricopeptide repeat protein [Clostridiaceae bacterium]
MVSKKDKKTVWIYAVVLFTSAFIVLMITTYSQIKVNKNIDDVKNKLGDTEKEKSNFQMNLSTALSENKKLAEKIEILDKEIEDARIKESELKQEIRNIVNDNDFKLENYQNLIIADIKYHDGDIKECALILTREIDIELLEKDALELYQKLLNKSVKKASLVFYTEGYEYYKEREYDFAIDSLEKSLSLEKNEYYSDDCYYFIAYSHYRKGNYYAARQAMGTLISNYPDSTYKKEATDFLALNK